MRERCARRTTLCGDWRHLSRGSALVSRQPNDDAGRECKSVSLGLTSREERMCKRKRKKRCRKKLPKSSLAHPPRTWKSGRSSARPFSGPCSVSSCCPRSFSSYVSIGGCLGRISHDFYTLGGHLFGVWFAWGLQGNWISREMAPWFLRALLALGTGHYFYVPLYLAVLCSSLLLPEEYVRRFFCEITSQCFFVLSSCWFDSGHIFTSVHGSVGDFTDFS